MRKRQELQQYLDEQLQRIEGQGPTSTFDQLEEKLNQIERKLVSLKGHHVPQPKIPSKPAEVEKEFKQTRKKKQVVCQAESKAKKQDEAVSEYIRVEQEAQITPHKQLNIISKTMSEGHFHFNTKSNNKSSEKKPNNKKYESQAKTAKNNQLKSNQKYNSPLVKHSLNSTAKKSTKGPINDNKSSSKKVSQRAISQKYLNKTHDCQLINLQKDIEQCMKSNAQLKVKVTQLEGYKTQFCKLKDIFSKFQRQRKRKSD